MTRRPTGTWVPRARRCHYCHTPGNYRVRGHQAGLVYLCQAHAAQAGHVLGVTWRLSRPPVDTDTPPHPYGKQGPFQTVRNVRAGKR